MAPARAGSRAPGGREAVELGRSLDTPRPAPLPAEIGRTLRRGGGADGAVGPAATGSDEGA